MDITVEQFALATGATVENAAKYHEAALEAMDRYRISETPVQIAAFCGTVGIECTHLTRFEEDLYYRDAERLAKLFKRAFDENHDGTVSFEEITKARAYCKMPQALSEKLYGGYHGRGAIQLTWQKNYKVHGDRIGLDYVTNPEWVCRPLDAFLTAGSFWDLNGCNAVAHDMDEVTLRVNGPRRLALAERIALRNKALEVL